MSKYEIHHKHQMDAIENSIRLLSAEILRLIRLPYKSWKNQEAIRSLDKQIEYLEEVMSKFERDLKKNK